MYCINYYVKCKTILHIFQTVIEALKYITTGVMPPGSNRGGAFVHDPKVGTST
jgi:hypothetical protein